MEQLATEEGPGAGGAASCRGRTRSRWSSYLQRKDQAHVVQLAAEEGPGTCGAAASTLCRKEAE